jgi:DNA-binding NarL/FixJ family response regulator
VSGLIRVLVADDHPVVREGLAAMLGTQADLVVVGEASDGVEAARKCAELRPDVMLLDLGMPEMDGVEVIRQLRESSPGTRVVVLTAFDTDDRIVAAVKAGAQGYLLKGVPRSEIFEAVRVVHGGGSLLQPIVASRLLRRFSQEERTETEAQAAQEPLSERQIGVLRLMSRGLQNKEIAVELGITESTVKFHVSRLLKAFGAGNRTELVTKAARQGVLDRA